jgi:hypothetical protein
LDPRLALSTGDRSQTVLNWGLTPKKTLKKSSKNKVVEVYFYLTITGV